MEVQQDPIYRVYPGPVSTFVTAGVIAFFSFFFFFVAYTAFSHVPISIGVVAIGLGAGALFLAWALALVYGYYYSAYRFDFYETYFHIRCGKSKTYDVKYENITGHHFLHIPIPGKMGPRNQIYLMINQEGCPERLEITGNPMNIGVGIKLDDWLQQKVPPSALK